MKRAACLIPCRDVIGIHSLIPVNDLISINRCTRKKDKIFKTNMENRNDYCLNVSYNNSLRGLSYALSMSVGRMSS